MRKEAEHYQPELEGFSDAYVTHPGDRITPEKLQYFQSVVAQVRADAPGRYLQRERERLSRPPSAEALARRKKQERLLRPLGSRATA